MDEEYASNSSIIRNLEGEETMGKVVLFVVISIFTGILFLLLLHLYARLFWWRVEQHFNPNPNLIQSNEPGSTIIGRNHGRHHFIFAQTQDDPPPLHNTGLDSKILQSIHVVVFKSTDFRDGLECAVCLSDLVDGDKARVLSRCNHGFHVDCIDMWFQSHSTCPLCRSTVCSVEDPVHEANEGLSQNQNFDSNDQRPVLGFQTEPLNFPTNILVWGDQNQARTADFVVSQDSSSVNIVDSSNGHNNQLESSSTDTCNRAPEVTAIVVDIPANSSENISERTDQEEPKSPMFTRLRSLKKFLSREKKDVVCTIGSSGTTTNNSNV